MKSQRPVSFIAKSLRSSAGMSLIEILIALTLLALAGTFITGQVFKSLHEGRVNSARIQMQNVVGRLKEFRRKCGFYPTQLDDLVRKPSSGRECRRYPSGGFIEGGKVPLDPWDFPFQYSSTGKEYTIFSTGADGAVGGEDEDADIPLTREEGTEY